MSYSPTLETWTEADPTQYIDGMNRYEFVHDSPIDRTDPHGLYDEAGHYWTTYALALMAGWPSADAANLAYWSQYSDLDPRYDAIGALSRWRLDQAEMIQDYLHSLSADPVKRRCILTHLLQNPDLPPNQRGILIHALGDAYAHTFDLFGEHGFAPPFGHTLGGHAPDHIGNAPGKYEQYVQNLYGLLGGAADDPNLQAFLASVPNCPAITFLDDAGISADESQWGHDWVQRLLGYDPGDVPVLDPNREMNPEDIDALINMIRQEAKSGCCK